MERKHLEIYKNIAGDIVDSGEALKNYFPSPSDEDYERGYVNRYFAKKIGIINGEIIEISKEQYDEYNGNLSTYNGLMHKFLMIEWKIKGRIRDLHENGVLIESGILDANLRTLRNAETIMPGIMNKFKIDFSSQSSIMKTYEILTQFAKK